MKKTCIFVFAFLGLLCLTTKDIMAQDIMITKEGQKIEAKIEEISIDVIKYKKFNNQTGASYLISKKYVASILYENGDFEVFTEQSQKPFKDEVKKTNATDEYKKAKNLFNIGIGVTVGGAVFFGTGIGLLAAYKRAVHELYSNLGIESSYVYDIAGDVYDAGVATITIGSVATASGIVCLLIGNKRMKANGDIGLVETKKCRLDMAIGGNNVGFKLKF